MSETDPSPMTAPAPPAGEPPISAGAALAGVFLQPGATFTRLLARPTWWLPFVLGLAVTLVSVLVVTPKIDMEKTVREAMEKQAEKSGQAVSPERVQRATEVSKKFGALAAPIGTAVVAVLFFLIVLILWGSARAFGAEVSYTQVLSVWGHANLTNLLGALFGLPLFLQLPNESITQVAAAKVVKSNLGAFLGESAKGSLLAFGSSIDIFALFALALLVVGFRRFPGLSKATGTAVPVGLWVVYVLAKVGWAAVFS